MQLHLENPSPRYAKARLVEPTSEGFIYIAAVVHRTKSPVVLPNAERTHLLQHVKQLARELERVPGVIRATVFRAIVRPPTERMSAYLRERGGSVPTANFDTIVLIETTSIASAREARASRECEVLLNTLQEHASMMYVMAARNEKRIADVDTTKKGLFLFNHFSADDRDIMLQLWDYLAGWYAVETRLENSVALTPLEGEPADYAIVNWARWNVSPLRHFWNQLSKRSFWKYVVRNLDANRAASQPIYCRLA